MEKNNMTGYGLLAIALAILVFSVVWITKNDSSTGLSVGNSDTSMAMSSEGFSSYEEMMQAHHGGGATQGASDGCGGIQEGAAASKLVGTVSKYGVEYGNKGYKQLLDAAESVKVTAAQDSVFVGLDIGMPCCGVKTLQAKDNCGCGHHVALFGLAKQLASQGVERAAIQEEINNWKDVFYPGGVSSDTGACG